MDVDTIEAVGNDTGAPFYAYPGFLTDIKLACRKLQPEDLAEMSDEECAEYVSAMLMKTVAPAAIAFIRMASGDEQFIPECREFREADRAAAERHTRIRQSLRRVCNRVAESSLFSSKGVRGKSKSGADIIEAIERTIEAIDRWRSELVDLLESVEESEAEYIAFMAARLRTGE